MCDGLSLYVSLYVFLCVSLYVFLYVSWYVWRSVLLKRVCASQNSFVVYGGMAWQTFAGTYEDTFWTHKDIYKDTCKDTHKDTYMGTYKDACKDTSKDTYKGTYEDTYMRIEGHV